MALANNVQSINRQLLVTATAFCIAVVVPLPARGSFAQAVTCQTVAFTAALARPKRALAPRPAHLPEISPAFINPNSPSHCVSNRFDTTHRFSPPTISLRSLRGPFRKEKLQKNPENCKKHKSRRPPAKPSAVSSHAHGLSPLTPLTVLTSSHFPTLTHAQRILVRALPVRSAR